jgi:hypothetical protein
VVLLTIKVEYILLCKTAKEVVWLQRLLGFFWAEQRSPTEIYKDNKSKIILVESAQTSQTTKHIEMRFHYTWVKISNKTIQMKYCFTNKMIVHGLTKALAPSNSHDSVMGSRRQRTSLTHQAEVFEPQCNSER